MKGRSICIVKQTNNENDRINLAQKQGPVLNTPARLAKALNKYNLTSRVSHGRLNMASSTIELDSVHVDVEVK